MRRTLSNASLPVIVSQLVRENGLASTGFSAIRLDCHSHLVSTLCSLSWFTCQFGFRLILREHLFINAAPRALHTIPGVWSC
ncbi:hypothetical protein LA5095_03809 [Roseibium album]|uniref:Uncharacterized protein n=1 Tax=Roseibium album TaxID=311410 RepID=A0A0M7AS91_9HYPH|nr:hypothetical protein LA5094_02750 [Roseibium album]CTQ76947.1 hypothetical protein LA5095_03809 [Roseibium album]CTQ77312.1 hypothetical protein LA5096_05091 [Roseibium album]